MNAFSKKTLTAAIGAVALAGAMAATSNSAEARSRYGAWVAGGVAAGIIGGALVANSYAAPAYAPSCWRERRPVYNRYGEIVGYRAIRVCE